MAFSFITRFLGRTTSEAVGFALGGSMRRPVDPPLQELTNATWKAFVKAGITVPTEPGDAAQIAAERVADEAWAKTQAAQLGIGGDQMDKLIAALRQAPPLGTLLTLLRRYPVRMTAKVAGDEQFEHGLRKNRYEDRWDDLLRDLADEPLGVSVIALAIVRGIMTDPGFLPVGPPSKEGKVKAFPVSKIDPLDEARWTGIGRERLFVETAIAGRPMGPESAAAAVFRDILERVDYDRAIAEGDVRNEWADAIFETARQIPSVADYVALHLRGHTDAAGMHAGAARHGMTAADADRIYLARGRPAAPGQMATAAARGIDGPAGRPMDRAQFLLGIAESDIRPEWGPMLWDARFLYPPLFQLSRLVQAGAIDADTAADWARKDRYPPEVVTALHAYWLTLKPATATDAVAKLATTQARAALKKRYLVSHIDSAGVLTGLELLGSDPAGAGHILEMWTLERGWLVKPLTPSQIKKLYREGTYSIDEAADALIELHMSDGDARAYLTS